MNFAKLALIFLQFLEVEERQNAEDITVERFIHG